MIALDGFEAALRGAFSGDPGLAPLLVKYYISVLLIFWPALRVIERFGRRLAGAFLLFLPLLGFAALVVWLALPAGTKPGAQAGDA